MVRVPDNKLIQLILAAVVGLASLSQERVFAFTSSSSCTKAKHTVQIKNLKSRTIGWAVQRVKRNQFMSSSIAEIEDLSEQIPNSVDATNHDINNEHVLVSKKSPATNEVWIARLLLLLSAALYGTNFTMVKSLDESLSVGISSTLRFGFAAFCMLPWLLAPIHEDLKVLTKEKLLKSQTDLEICSYQEPTRLAAGLAGLEIGAYNSIGYITQAVGLKTIPANKSAFICSMAVVIVPILDFVFGKELLKRQVLGACFAAIGVYALEMGGEHGSSLNSGDLVSLVQPFMFGLGFWRMEAAMDKYPTEAGRLAAAQLLMIFIVSLSYLICGAPFTDTCEVLPSANELMAWLHDPNIIGMLFWTGIVTTAFTIWMETLALKTLSAAETTLIFSTEPLFGAAFASIVANECFGREGAIGAAFIIGGCLVSGLDLETNLKRFMSL